MMDAELVLLPYGCGLVSSVATVRLRVGEQCCYRTVVGSRAVSLPYGCGLTVLLPYGCGMVSIVATYGCRLVSSVATVRLQVGSVATVRLHVGSVATVRLRVGNEQCCYGKFASWQVDLNKDVTVA
jgi:hypothetical protein